MKLKKLKNTKSTYPIDIPSKLRKEYDIFLAKPLTDIINSSFYQQEFPSLWKIEYVTPIAKVKLPTKFSQIRKIATLSDYSKLYENFLKDLVIEDIGKN